MLLEQVMQLLAKPRGIQRLRLLSTMSNLGWTLPGVQKPVGVFIPTQPLRASTLDHGYGLSSRALSQPDTGWYSVTALLLASPPRWFTISTYPANWL